MLSASVAILAVVAALLAGNGADAKGKAQLLVCVGACVRVCGDVCAGVRGHYQIYAHTHIDYRYRIIELALRASECAPGVCVCIQ